MGQSTAGLLAVDDFSSGTGALHGASPGSGWAGAWFTQNNDVTVPGYNLTAGSLSFPNLATGGNRCVGGNAWLATGRALDVSAAGPFAAYVSNGNIGASGTAVYVSALLVKSATNSDEVSLTLHAGNTEWNASPAALSVGYFGSASDLGGVRYWSLRVGSTVYRSAVPVVVGQAALLVVKIEFGASSVASLYVNPASLGGATPVSASVSGSTSGSLAFRHVTFYGGNGSGQGAIDEIRLGSTFAAVTPTQDTTPPGVPGGLAASAVTETSFNLSWSAAADNQGGSGVNGYEVFVQGVSAGVTAATSFSLSGLTAGTSYSVTIRARDGAGNWSAHSAALSVTTLSLVPEGALLAYDDFNAATGSLHGATTGSGWSAGWFTQNNDVTVPGYALGSGSLSFSGLITRGNSAMGGNAWLSTGRTLDVSNGGPFTSYLSGGLIGAAGKTLYISSLLRKAAANTDEVSLTLHAGSTAWLASPALVAAGYFGVASDNGGVRYWSLRIGATVYRTNVPVTTGQAALLVIKVDFGSTNQVSLFVNPSSLGGSAPASAQASGSTTSSLGFSAVAFYGGNGVNQGAMDEIRLGETFGAVTPVTDTPVDTTPPSIPAGLAATATTPSSISISWSASTDNAGGSGLFGYEVFRNGTSAGTTASTSFTLPGLQAATTYAITVRARDVAGNWSAQGSVLSATTQPALADTTPPGVPSGLTALTSTSSTISLSWSASTDNAGGSGLFGYEIFNNGASAGTATAPPFTIAGLLPATAYAFTVRARDVAGNWSALSSALNASTQPVEQSPDRVHSIGINTNGPHDYNIDKPFADAMRSHRQWNRIGDSQGNGTSSIPLDVNGWPMQDGTALVYHGLNTQNNHGTYKLSFTGQADLSVNGGGASSSNKVYNSATNTTTADIVISAPSNLDLWITFTNTRRLPGDAAGNGVTDVKLMRPVSPGSTQAYPASRVYADDYLNKLQPFSVIRFMGWLNANWCPDDTWATHTTWNYATQNRYAAGSGRNHAASWESVILLANAANKDAWITLPHMANDEYITKVAQMFRYGSNGVEPYTSTQANPVVPPLNANLKLYVEYSNEVWNNDFSQTQWVRTTGASYGAPLNFDGETDAVTLGFRYKAMRTVQISNIFRSVFGDAAMPAPGKHASQVTVRPVLEWQLGYNDLTNRTLSFIDRYYNKRDSRSTWADPHPVSYYLYGGGGSGYWYTDGSTTMTADNLWNNGTWNPESFTTQLFRDAAWAKAFGLTYLAYEGDAHPAGAGYGGSNNDASIMTQTHWDSRMYAETQEHLEAFSSLDGDQFIFLVLQNLTSSFWGTYNLLGGLSNSPQYQVIQAMGGTPATPIARGSVVPFTRPGAAYDVATYESPATATGSATLQANNWFATAYTFRSTSSGIVQVRVEYSTTAAATLVLEYDGVVIGTYRVNSTGGSAAFTPWVNVSCAADRLHALRLVSTAGSVTVRNIIVNHVPTAAAVSTLSGEAASTPAVEVYPNPANATVNVIVRAADQQENTVLIRITDMMHQTVLSTREALVEGENTVQIPTGQLKDGVYVLMIQTGNKQVVQRVLIDR